MSEETRARLEQLYAVQGVHKTNSAHRDWPEPTSIYFLSLFLPIFAILLIAIWIWALIDCLRNEPSEGNDKIVWVLVIILLNGLGALIYLIVRRPERVRRYGC